jgi:hypothetical protein
LKPTPIEKSAKLERPTASPHPSLEAEFVAPTPLDPKQVMYPYAPCWCGSGTKWKWCHKDRSKQKPHAIGALFATVNEELRSGYCSHPNADTSTCSDRIIRAHTVQRNGGLSHIAEDGHVLSVRAGSQEMFKNHGVITPTSVGIRSATTFNGFCQTHDAAMFRPFEVEHRVLTRENCFLLSFRALAYELYTKRISFKSLSAQKNLDRGESFEKQVAIQQYLHAYSHGLERGLRDLTAWKEEYDRTYVTGDYSRYSFYAVAFSETIPIVACGAFHPEIDFDERELQIISRGDAAFDHLTFSLFPLEGLSVAVFGWTATGSDAARQFIESFKRIENCQKANAAVHLAFEQLENTCLRPSWWGSLSGEQRAFAERKFKSGIGPDNDRSIQSLRHSSQVFVSAAVVDTLEG